MSKAWLVIMVGYYLVRSGVLAPGLRVHRDVGAIWQLVTWGPSIAGGYRASTVRAPRVTWIEVARRCAPAPAGSGSPGAAGASEVDRPQRPVEEADTGTPQLEKEPGQRKTARRDYPDGG